METLQTPKEENHNSRKSYIKENHGRPEDNLRKLLKVWKTNIKENH